MRPKAARGDVPFLVDLAIAGALLFSAAYFILVNEYRIGSGGLTRTELLLLGEPAQAVQALPAKAEHKQQN